MLRNRPILNLRHRFALDDRPRHLAIHGGRGYCRKIPTTLGCATPQQPSGGKAAKRSPARRSSPRGGIRASASFCGEKKKEAGRPSPPIKKPFSPSFGTLWRFGPSQVLRPACKHPKSPIQSDQAHIRRPPHALAAGCAILRAGYFRRSGVAHFPNEPRRHRKRQRRRNCAISSKRPSKVSHMHERRADAA